ncbi:uncharacterized protein VTP21DRAFT_8717 [Calcarisporiella thermophila]|uniref:uncharacterized protein n=1 Tax=Calcarisporiella thermophila TaxID=911321 RepID=UPI003742F0C3
MLSVSLVVSKENTPVELQDGVAELIQDTPHRNLVSEEDMLDFDGEYKWNLKFVYDESLRPRQLIVNASHSNYKSLLEHEKFEVIIRYKRKIEAFRGVGKLLSIVRRIDDTDNIDDSGNVEEILNFVEEAQFETLGLMIDCSRNGVLKLDVAFFLLRRMALIGINMLQLYTEDTFEVEGEPFFGYLRGRYTQKELAAIDDYAYDLGIEVVPCIQTLGHLGQILQWPSYTYLKDTHEVLLAKSEETYDFLEKIIRQASAPFRSKRIHIGMDEAHGIGEGRFKNIFGPRDPIQIFCEHLQRVNDICQRMGLRAMIWSDMLFCLAAKNNSLQGYYENTINPADIEMCEIPKEIELVYWDYYHTIPEIYAQKIQQHKELGCSNPWVATGSWTWSRFWTALPFSFETIRAAALPAKDKKEGIDNFMITIWGDEGNEFDIFSSFPSLVYFAEHGYTLEDEVDMTAVRFGFEGIFGGDFNDYVHASKLDDVNPQNLPLDNRAHFAQNMSKWLLWEDPFLSFMSPQYAHLDLESHYNSLSTYLYKSIESKSSINPLNSRLEFPALIASALALKCCLRDRLAQAYLAKDKALAYELVEGRLSKLREIVERLWKYHRKIWMETYKPFGWEVLELRYGGLRARLETMQERVMEWIKSEDSVVEDGEDNGSRSNAIPEFEVELQCIFEHSRTNLLLDYARVSVPSRLG